MPMTWINVDEWNITDSACPTKKSPGPEEPANRGLMTNPNNAL